MINYPSLAILTSLIFSTKPSSRKISVSAFRMLLSRTRIWRKETGSEKCWGEEMRGGVCGIIRRGRGGRITINPLRKIFTFDSVLHLYSIIWSCVSSRYVTDFSFSLRTWRKTVQLLERHISNLGIYFNRNTLGFHFNT